MKKITVFLISALAASIMLAGCGDNDSNASSNEPSSSKTTTTASTDRDQKTETNKKTSSQSDVLHGDVNSDGDTVVSKADRIGDDIADGINGGLDATESIVDEILR